MVRVFKRSLSFPNKPKSHRPKISQEIRSISLPCRPLPLISQLGSEINHLKSSWPSSLNRNTVAWLCDGLSRLKNVQDSLDDLLQLPQTQECLALHPQLVEMLREDFLRFLDVYGIFQASFLALKEALLVAEVGLRKKDVSKIELYHDSCKRIGKEMDKLAQAVKAVNVGVEVGSAQEQFEVVNVVGEVIEVTISVTFALCHGISISLAAPKQSTWGALVARVLAKKKNKKVDEIFEGIREFKVLVGLELKNDVGDNEDDTQAYLRKVRDLEGCACDIESCSDKVYRGLINARVSLLNCMG